MSDIPDATELLAIARSTLLDKLLPRVPEELRYDALMIANAMAIAAREHTAGDAAMQAEVVRLAALLKEQCEPRAGAELISARIELTAASPRISAPAASTTGTARHYSIISRRRLPTKLAVSNPRALEA